MEAFPTLLALCEGNPPVTGGFPSKRPVTRSFDVFFYQRLSKRLSKQSGRRWFETPSRSLWRQSNDVSDFQCVRKCVFCTSSFVLSWQQAPVVISNCFRIATTDWTSNGSWCMGIKGEMSGTVCVTFTWDMYIYIWVVYSLCFFCCLFITVTWYVWCIEWASGNQEEVQACLVTLWLFIISCYSLYKTTLGLLCSWFENNPHFHKYSMDFHV